MTSWQTIPARYGKAVRLARGERIEVVNTHGSQVLDTWAFAADDVNEHLSMEHTRSVNSQIYAHAGDVLHSNLRRPMLSFVEDTSPGRHDTLLCSCNDALYRSLGCTEYHRNCHDNLFEASDEVGLFPPHAPSPLNLFMNVRIDQNGQVLRAPPASRPGDRVAFAAEMDLIIVFSSCPQDITPVNGQECLPTDAHFCIHQAVA